MRFLPAGSLFATISSPSERGAFISTTGLRKKVLPRWLHKVATALGEISRNLQEFFAEPCLRGSHPSSLPPYLPLLSFILAQSTRSSLYFLPRLCHFCDNLLGRIFPEFLEASRMGISNIQSFKAWIPVVTWGRGGRERGLLLLPILQLPPPPLCYTRLI